MSAEEAERVKKSHSQTIYFYLEQHAPINWAQWDQEHALRN